MFFRTYHYIYSPLDDVPHDVFFLLLDVLMITSPLLIITNTQNNDALSIIKDNLSRFSLSKSRRKIPSRHDRFFHLPTVLAENDPFLRRLYSVVSLVLDDHPYPATPNNFKRRTAEIKQNVRKFKSFSRSKQFSSSSNERNRC